MTRPTLKELKELWRYAYARSAHNDALAYIDAVDKIPAGDLFGMSVRQGLVAATIASYVRPFTRSYYGPKEFLEALGGVPLPTEPDLAEEHERLIKLRHKMVGHKDAQPWDENVETPNRLVIDRTGTYFDLHTITLNGFDDGTANRIRKLCAHFLNHSTERIGAILRPHMETILAMPEGRWELRLTEAPDPWIVSVGNK